MSDVQIIRELMNSARARPKVDIEELSDDSQTDVLKPDDHDDTKTFDLSGGKDRNTDDTFINEILQKGDSKDGLDDVDETSEHVDNLTGAGHSDSDGHDADDEDGRDAEQSCHEDDELADEHDFLLDMDEQRASLENLGTLLSAFFQDDRGLNVVDAIVQNSKVQNKICKTLERIADHLEKA